MREYLIIVRGTCVNWPEMYSLGSVGPIWPQMKLQIRPNWHPASRCPKLMTFHKAKGHSSHRTEVEHEHTPYGLKQRCFRIAVQRITTWCSPAAEVENRSQENVRNNRKRSREWQAWEGQESQNNEKEHYTREMEKWLEIIIQQGLYEKLSWDVCVSIWLVFNVCSQFRMLNLIS